MTHARLRRVRGILATGLASLIAACLLHGPAAAQGGTAPGGGDNPLAPALTLSVPAAIERTLGEPAVTEATRLRPPLRAIPFRPTMDPDAYRGAKSALAAQAPPRRAPAAALPVPLAPPTLRNINCNGVNEAQAGGLFPPDTHGAAGDMQFVQIVNSHLLAYAKQPAFGTCPTLLFDTSLANLFGYFAHILFDPRVIYDHVWKRFVVTAAGGTQFHFIGISQTEDALGPYFIYPLDVSSITASFGGDAWDFPQLGMDQDAIIITANIFNGTQFVGAAMVPLAKALIYNGLPLPSTSVFNLGTLGTVAPPIVLDQNVSAFLVSAPNEGTALKLFTLRESSRSVPVLTGPVDVDVTDYSLPPDAPQPGTTQLIDTSDNRFANASTQVGNDLFQVHTQNRGGHATSVLYRIDTATQTALLELPVSAGNGSHDFNPSIAADTASPRDVYVTWSSTNVTPGSETNAQVRFGGFTVGDLITVLSGTAASTSLAPLIGNEDPPGSGVQRWGDYSAITINPPRLRDPTHRPSKAFGTNEVVTSPGSTWSSQIFKVGIQ